MTPTEALASVPAGTPRHSRTYPRVGSVWTVDQVRCLERARELLDAALSECAMGEIEADWIDVCLDNIDLAIPRIQERIAAWEAQAEAESDIARERQFLKRDRVTGEYYSPRQGG